jgi:hypothetical protein
MSSPGFMMTQPAMCGKVGCGHSSHSLTTQDRANFVAECEQSTQDLDADLHCGGRVCAGDMSANNAKAHMCAACKLHYSMVFISSRYFVTNTRACMMSNTMIQNNAALARYSMVS